MASIKLVTFDVYMALLDIEGSLTPRLASALGLTREAALPLVRLWRAKQMERAASSNSIGGKRTRFRDCTRMALDYVLERHGHALDGETRHDLVMAWDALEPWPDARDCISAVRAEGYATAILSNGDQDMLDAIGRHVGGFDHILSSETAGWYKPHPSVYALPTDVLGIAKADVVHVAGSSNDVLGACAAGMCCIWSNRNGDILLDPAFAPDREVSTLAKVPKAIADIIA